MMLGNQQSARGIDRPKKTIGMLMEHESGVSIAEICRAYGLSSATFYKFKRQHTAE